ncbi:hypothetical protein HMPREF1084_01921 [Clostridium butyricum 60E.3]|uniref:hypothetical protein n=1 Tax=Clostridium butyricum TaxID=1492 RepID=UPI0002D16ACD|nr:hypothetical protein [Clostridium butyricum]ENZ33452.1 hypothetical protein HMPREF1084_01921 [Clostridium butyricum 60E.3]
MKISKNNKRYITLATVILILGGLGVCYKYKQKEKTSIQQLEIIDVDKNDTIESEKEQIINNSKFMHLSLDDFILSFEDITKNDDEYDSIFDNETFRYLKTLHDEYGVVISCYSYYRTDNKKFNLSQCTDKYKQEFIENSDWLKFGFHVFSGDKNYKDSNKKEAQDDYTKVMNELLRITGSEKSIDRVIRLQNFAGNKESVQAMEEIDNGIIGVLGADDRRRSYYLDDSNNSYLYEYDYYNDNGLNFFKTDLRMESVDNIDDALNELDDDNKDILIIFTHEWQLPNEDIKSKLEKCCKFAKNNGYSFDYPMNRL